MSGRCGTKSDKLRLAINILGEKQLSRPCGSACRDEHGIAARNGEATAGLFYVVLLANGKVSRKVEARLDAADGALGRSHVTTTMTTATTTEYIDSEGTVHTKIIK